MATSTDSNKKIEKKTLFVYFRFFATIVISLYSSRIVLQVLGASDFGIFSVVGSILGMFAFMTVNSHFKSSCIPLYK